MEAPPGSTVSSDSSKAILHIVSHPPIFLDVGLLQEVISALLPAPEVGITP